MTVHRTHWKTNFLRTGAQKRERADPQLRRDTISLKYYVYPVFISLSCFQKRVLVSQLASQQHTVCVEKSKLLTVPFPMDSNLTIPQTFPNTRSCLRTVAVCICADPNDVQREVPLFVFLFNKTLQTQPYGTVLGLGQVKGRGLLVYIAETRTAHLHTLLNNKRQRCT
jgi:hypothetical protein